MDIGRLALRVEGNLWVAYYALTDTMQDALFLGSINMRFVQQVERKQAFMDLMQEAVADIIEEKTGERPTWTMPRSAPEHERSGRA
jgi:hypothetical protein